MLVGGTGRVRRVAGLRRFETPTLEGVERRRGELLALSLVVLILSAGALVMLSFVDEMPEWFHTFGGTINAMRAGLVILVCAFGAYLVDNERRLRGVSKFLVNEQVLSAALANRLKEISALSDAGKAVSSALEIDDVLTIILNAAFELLEADEGSIMLVEGDELVVAAAAGHPRRYVGERRPITEGLSGYVARTREQLIVEGTVEVAETPSRDKKDVSSALLVPMEARAELLGVLNLNVTTGTRRYTEYELRALGLFAEHAAMAIRHARALERERELRAHAVELDRVRAQLVGSMAHDLKSPLTAILGSAKLLIDKSEQLDAAGRRQFAEAIARQSSRLLALIERLLEAARSQAQQLPLAPGPLDVIPAIKALAESYASAYSRDIQVDSGEARVIAYADAEAMEQVIGNLLENAVRHTPEGTRVRIRVTPDNGRAVVTVSDDGPGIPPDQLDSIFVPFLRADAKGGSSGLGLFVVSNLVKAMGGDISVESTPGQGASFTVSLPTHAGSAA